MQADLKTIAAHNMVGLSCVSAITAQNNTELRALEATSVELLHSQLKVLFAAYPIGAVKCGLLPNRACIESLVSTLSACLATTTPLVVDPVLLASSGSKLTDEDVSSALIDTLVPLATLVTPNRHEAERLTRQELRSEEDVVKAGRALIEMGCGNVLIKGGHLDFARGVDFLIQASDLNNPTLIKGEFISGRQVRGTGCTYATAIACELTRTPDLEDAIRKARLYLSTTIRNAYEVTPGHWLPDHFAATA